MHAKELSGKDVIDANGNKVGEVDDIEIDVKTKTVTGIVAKEGSISSKLGRGEEKMISVDMIDSIGDEIILRRMKKRM